jgi:hypothetical protein
MLTVLDQLSQRELLEMSKEFQNARPFNYIVLDNFLENDVALKLAAEFPNFDAENIWYEYENPLEIKKATNNWNVFPAVTYQYFKHVLSDEFTRKIEIMLFGEEHGKLVADIGLHGGGFHTHKNGGRLNPHLDYSIHPKLGLQRTANLILYINPHWKPAYGGAFGLWEHEAITDSPGELSKVVDCLFNRAVIFNTTQNSWHGICNEVSSPEGETRNSLATYYLMPPANTADPRMKVKYAPTEEQRGDKEIEKLIEERQSILTFDKVYKHK